MLITTRDVTVIRGKTNNNYHVTTTVETVLIPESREDQDIIDVFVNQNMPIIED